MKLDVDLEFFRYGVRPLITVTQQTTRELHDPWFDHSSGLYYAKVRRDRLSLSLYPVFILGVHIKF